MNASTTSSRTEGQERSFKRLTEDASRHGAELALQKVEADSKGWQRVLMHGDDLKTAVADVIVAKTRELALRSASQERAREIMGKNFFGVEEAIKHFGVNPTRQQLAAFSEIAFSEAVLEESKDTHVLAAVFPLSILEIRGKVSQGQRLFYDQDWYNKQAFAKERGETEWRLIRKTPVDNSISKNWQDQTALLGKNDEVPAAQVMVYAIVGHYLATGERMFEHLYVRTSSVDSDGSRVYVGVFVAGGLCVDYCWGDYRRGCLGVASARKS